MALTLSTWGLVASCVSANDRTLRPQQEATGGSSGIELDGGGGSVTVPPDAAPHAVLGIDPAHGPFSGGTLALIRGNGFASNARVFFGEAELPAEAVVAIDAQRLQVTVPPGQAGPVDVVVQNGDDASTRGELVDGYVYDAFHADPPTGPTAGGTLIRLFGQNTGWTDATRVEIDREPCVVEELVSDVELVCRTPRGSAGAKLVRTETDGELIDVLDAFTYVNSDNGFRGGISGDPLESNLTVLAFDDVTGEAIEGATVIVGEDAATALTATTDGDGVAGLASEDWDGAVTVTVAKHCFQPITFVDVPSSRVTVYLDPVLSAACGAGGGLPGGGGTAGRAAGITGELVWEVTGEFRRSGWTNVPPPVTEEEKYVAYVFRLASDPTDTFTLPSAINAVTTSSSGTAGYAYQLTTAPGNHTLYALAGILDESKSPPAFTAYAMGITQGVAVGPNQTHEDVFIDIDLTLDHALTLAVTGPEPTNRGPDRLQATLAVGVGSQGYVLLPNGYQERLLPVSGSLDFVGVPPLVGSLAGARYVTTARAVTGEAEAQPLSVVGLLSTTVTSEPIGADAFVEIPRLTSPGTNETWNGTALELAFTAGGAPVSLTLLDIESGAGLITWRIVMPGAKETVRVPDLREFEGDLGLVPGPLSVLVTAARLDDFAYSALRYRDLGVRGFRSYAQDLYFADL